MMALHHVHIWIHRGTDDAGFEESKHPRGNAKNAGQFSLAPASGAGAKGARTHAEGTSLPKHIAELKIPPAWTDVHYDTNPKADLLVIGKDAKGRRQAIYSEKFKSTNAEFKFKRIKELDKKFDRIRTENDRARKSRDPKIRDSADCAALIMSTGVRPGSEDDTGAEKRAYGATTLEGRHVVVGKDGSVTLSFVGKKGVALNIPVEDPEIAAMLSGRKNGDNDPLFPSTNDSVLLRHVHSLDGGSFKTKDFRTLVGTRSAMTDMKAIAAPKNMVEYKKKVREVAIKVAARLGNTPTVALQSYINPTVFSEWRGRLAA
jgi:DNA topoisomerase-1